MHTMCTQVYAICGRGGKGARKKTGGYDRPLLIPGYRHCTNMHNYQLLNQLSTVLDWMRFEGNEYFFSTIEMSWYDSRTRCQSLDADLISIASQQEQEFVDQHADYRYVHRTPVDRNKSSCINKPTTGTFTASVLNSETTPTIGTKSRSDYDVSTCTQGECCLTWQSVRVLDWSDSA